MTAEWTIVWMLLWSIFGFSHPPAPSLPEAVPSLSDKLPLESRDLLGQLLEEAHARVKALGESV